MKKRLTNTKMKYLGLKFKLSMKKIMGKAQR
jgi:hypothetical protein